MKQYLDSILNSLNKKMVTFLVIILGVSLSVTTFLSITMERSNALQLARERVQHLVEVIQSNMIPAMQEGRCKSLATIIRSLTSSSEYLFVRVFDRDGRIIASTREEEDGKIFNMARLNKKIEDIVLSRAEDGGRIFAATKPFYNETRCSVCHDRETKVLAYLNVDLSLSSIETRLSSSTKRKIYLDFGIIVALCGAMYLFFSRTLKRRILDVSSKMAEVEKGNFDVQVAADNRDELGLMAKTFNFMVRNLDEMRKRNEEQQKLLMRGNEDLQKMVEEQNILYQSSKAINNFLQIEEILQVTLEKIAQGLGFDRAILMLLDEKGKVLKGRWSIGVDKEIVRQVGIPGEDIKGVLLETLQKGEPVVVRNSSPPLEANGRDAKKCWQVLDCKDDSCLVYGTQELRCWMMLGTRCDRTMRENTYEEKMHVCHNCSYIKEIAKQNDIVNILFLGSNSFIAVPLVTREQTLGVLLADKVRSDDREISEEDIKLLVTIISHISIAIENAALYQKLEKKVDFSQRQLEETNGKLRYKVDELNRIRSFNESILQNLYGGIVTYTNDGKITFINKAQLELTDWTEEEVLGKSVYQIFCRDEGEKSVLQMSSVGDNGFFGETEILKRGGEKVPVEVFLSRLKDEENNIIGVTAIFRDITEKREIEERMQRMDKLASLGQLASGIAHEIKNPLAGIGSAIQVLSSSIALDDMKKEVVKEILKQIRKLDETIKNLLSFAKPGQPRLAPTNLNDILQVIIFLTAQQVKQQNIKIQLDARNDIPEIMVDSQQIQQAILNVVLNSIEAMPQGGALRIALKVKYLPGFSKKGKRYLSIIISDKGTGIPEDSMSQIFNPFYTTKPSGTGLGLSITQRIIEQHNGMVNLRSEPGKGTVFTIDLPLELSRLEEVIRAKGSNHG